LKNLASTVGLGFGKSVGEQGKALVVLLVLLLLQSNKITKLKIPVEVYVKVN
jgi:hypothetical protein